MSRRMHEYFTVRRIFVWTYAGAGTIGLALVGAAAIGSLAGAALGPAVVLLMKWQQMARVPVAA